MLEANACGLPVAAYPVTGPIDVVRDGVTGCLNTDLKQACLDALTIDPTGCLDYARANSWRRCAMTALHYMTPMGTNADDAPAEAEEEPKPQCVTVKG